MSAVDCDELSSAGYRIVRRFGHGIPDGCSIPLSLKIQEDEKEKRVQRKLSKQGQIEEEIRRSYGAWSRRSVIAPWVYAEAAGFEQSEIIQKARQREKDAHRSLLSKLRRSLFPKKHHKRSKVASSISDGGSDHESMTDHDDPNSMSTASLGFFADPAVPEVLRKNPELLLLGLPELEEEADKHLIKEIKEGLRLFREQIYNSNTDHYDGDDDMDDKENRLEMIKMGAIKAISGHINGYSYTSNSGSVSPIYGGDDDDYHDEERTRL